MKRNKVSFLISVVICLSFIFLASACSKTEYERISNAYNDITKSQSVIKTVQVTQKETVLSLLEEKFTANGNGYRVIKKVKTLNAIGQGDGMYSETVFAPEEVEKKSVVFGPLPSQSHLTEVSFNEEELVLSLAAKLSDDFLKSYGDFDSVKDGVTVTMKVVDQKFTEMIFTYTTINGNEVLINYLYEY